MMGWVGWSLIVVTTLGQRGLAKWLGMARERLGMDKARSVLRHHYEGGWSGRAIARHCGLSRRSVSQTLERFSVSSLSWSEVSDLDDAALGGVALSWAFVG